MALSEHDLFFDPALDHPVNGPVLLPAVEVTSRTDQTLMFLGAGSDLPEKGRFTLADLARLASGTDGLFIVDHPNWIYKPGRRHATVDEIMAAPAAGHIEIYTGVIERLDGSPYALDVWDELLSRGKRVFGHAVDDQHRPSDRYKGWNIVQMPDSASIVTATSIIDALKVGRFVASTGVCVSAIGIGDDGNSITVASDAASVRWITNGGRCVRRREGGEDNLTFDAILAAIDSGAGQMAGVDLYVRVELKGSNGTFAWSQPFFFEVDE